MQDTGRNQGKTDRLTVAPQEFSDSLPTAIDAFGRAKPRADQHFVGWKPPDAIDSRGINSSALGSIEDCTEHQAPPIAGLLDQINQTLSRQNYRGRFAPSPTGPLHIGSLYTAVASFLQAKSRGGKWLLRIDDADRPRIAPGATDAILRCLDHFGLHWDGPVVHQSHETAAYDQAIRQLDADGWLFPCTCTRKMLAELPGAAFGRAIYPGTCRSRGTTRQPHALRVIAQDTVITINDGLQGPNSWNIARDMGDFVVFRRDGIFAYHLATVIDDCRAGVTEVFRGFDLLESTPLQIYLQRLLALPTPDYSHIPIIVDKQGLKLSKQNLAAPVNGRHASAILFTLLSMLRQLPPEELRNAPPPEMLAWAITAWDVSRLAGTAVTEPDWHRHGEDDDRHLT